jgi:hypothetical protein
LDISPIQYPTGNLKCTLDQAAVEDIVSQSENSIQGAQLNNIPGVLHVRSQLGRLLAIAVALERIADRLHADEFVPALEIRDIAVVRIDTSKQFTVPRNRIGDLYSALILSFAVAA